jgi:hypothetical protein
VRLLDAAALPGRLAALSPDEAARIGEQHESRVELDAARPGGAR